MSFRLRAGTAASTVVLVAAAALAQAAPAGAIGAVFGLDYYISAPLVQGTHVSGGVKENFNSLVSCSGSIGTGSAIAVSGDCVLESSANQFGGAVTDSATPTAGGSGSAFPIADNDPGTTFTLSGPQCYLGFYWTAGSGGNTVEFFSDGELVLSFNSDQIIAILNPSEVATLVSVGGTTYQKALWYGNPRGHSDIDSNGIPDGTSTLNDGEPYVYLNVYGKGGLTFNSVRFSGPNFEFDNLAFSSSCETPPSSSVYLGYVGEGEPESPNLRINPDYLTRTTEELPNTGASSNTLNWVALALAGGGISLLRIRRRLAEY